MMMPTIVVDNIPLSESKRPTTLYVYFTQSNDWYIFVYDKTSIL